MSSFNSLDTVGVTTFLCLLINNILVHFKTFKCRSVHIIFSQTIITHIDTIIYLYKLLDKQQLFKSQIVSIVSRLNTYSSQQYTIKRKKEMCFPDN